MHKECQSGTYNLLCPAPPRSDIPCKCDYQPYCYNNFFRNEKLSCTPGRSIKGPSNNGNYEVTLWETLDPYHGAATKCGVQYYTYSGSDPKVHEVGCSNPERKMIQFDTASLGYDAFNSSPPAGISSVSPNMNTIVYENESINVYFDRSIKADSVSFGGDMGSNVDPNFKFRRSIDFNDTLFVKPNGSWPLGRQKSLTINYKDLSDQPSNPVISFNIIPSGTSKTPSFGTCKVPCKLSWQESYAIQFTATGGVGPYKWYSAVSLPPGISLDLPASYYGALPPNASLSEQGVLSGPATNNFFGIYYFGVVVVDSVGQVYPELVVVDTTDLAAQLAACYLLGICG